MVRGEPFRYWAPIQATQDRFCIGLPLAGVFWLEKVGGVGIGRPIPHQLSNVITRRIFGDHNQAVHEL